MDEVEGRKRWDGWVDMWIGMSCLRVPLSPTLLYHYPLSSPIEQRVIFTLILLTGGQPLVCFVDDNVIKRVRERIDGIFLGTSDDANNGFFPSPMIDLRLLFYVFV